MTVYPEKPNTVLGFSDWEPPGYAGKTPHGRNDTKDARRFDYSV